MPIPEGYITVDQTVAQYGRSRAWWYRQISDRAITAYDVPGYRETFLRTEDVEKLLEPRPRLRDDETSSGQTA
jgi:hypothetical protein